VICALISLNMGKLEEYLKQREDITNYLEALVQVHKEALSDGSDGNQLDTVREHISVCFSDLLKINDKLISHNGILKNEMSKLIEVRAEVLELSTKEIELLKEKHIWDFDSSVPNKVLDNRTTKFTFETHYRDDMNNYIELVGITNTSLSRDYKEDNHGIEDNLYQKNTYEGSDENNSVLTRDDTLKCMTYLHNASSAVNKDIQALEGIIKNMKKDQNFLQDELKIQTSKIRTIKKRILNDIETINRRTEKILKEINLTIPNQSEVKDKKLISLAKGNSINNQIQLSREKVELEIEFIDIKKDTFAHMFKELKNETSGLKSQNELWKDCLEEVVSLEKKLKYKISRKGSGPIIPTDLIKIIQTSLNYLQELMNLNNSKVISSIIEDEKDTLIRACKELKKQLPVI